MTDEILFKISSEMGNGFVNLRTKHAGSEDELRVVGAANCGNALPSADFETLINDLVCSL